VNGCQIFGDLSPEEAHEIFEELAGADRGAYRSSLSIAARRRNLRPEFLERKPRRERHEWMRDVFARPRNNDAATEILQTWLLVCHRRMLVEFLDALKIDHEDGLIAEIPAQPPGVTAAIHALCGKYPPLITRTYLRLFQPPADNAWPELDQFLATETGLHPTPATP